jgi:hypothetical protein
MDGYINVFGIIMVLNSILTLSLIVSGLLSFAAWRISIIIYYVQFPLRLVFFTLTFGFVLKLSGLHIDSFAYKALLAFVIGLEVFRLIVSVRISKKHFTDRGTVAAQQQGLIGRPRIYGKSDLFRLIKVDES